jgi:hypothetical protein
VVWCARASGAARVVDLACLSCSLAVQMAKGRIGSLLPIARAGAPDSGPPSPPLIVILQAAAILLAVFAFVCLVWGSWELFLFLVVVVVLFMVLFAIMPCAPTAAVNFMVVFAVIAVVCAFALP